MSEMKQPPRPRGPMGHGPIGGGEKAKDFKGSVGKLLRYLGRYKVGICLVALFAVGSTVFSIVGPKILGNATTEVYTGLLSKISGGAGINFGKIGSILLWLLGLYLASALLSFLQGIIMTQITQKITYKIRRDIDEKINRLPMKYFDQKQHGETLSLITNDVDTLSMGLNQSATQLITSITTLAGVLLMMFSIDWIMTLVALIVLPVSAMVVSLVVKKSQGYFRQQQNYLGHVNGQVEETFGGLQVIQAFHQEDTVLEEFDKANQTLYKAGWRSQFFSGLMQPVMNFIGNLSYVAVAILGGVFAASGRITVGNIQSFISYTKNFTQPITQLAQVSNMMQSMAAAAERIFAFLEEEEEIQSVTQAAAIPLETIEGNVTFEHVHFGYNPDKIIIHDFNSQVQKGQKIAIVGPTGAGKTTIVKLLMRFYDLQSGTIRIDGHDICDFGRSQLRELFGMVLQDTWLFHGTILENLRYGRLDATDEEVIAAAKAAHAHSFIETLPGGYQMVLNEDATNISAGQRQLLTIARAILADNKILILDEATSSVDTRTEGLIQEAMDRLTEGRTSFIIAHRLSTIRNADWILVMKDGDIIEQGNHDTLMEQGGFYAGLYNSQFEKTSA